MHVVAQHPCPVRWRPGRGKDRIAYLALRTPVEIPELRKADFERDRRSYDVTDPDKAFLVHAGLCWEPVRIRAGAPPVPPDLFAEILTRRDGMPHGIASAGTPLCGNRLGDSEMGLHGEDLPDRILARTAQDHTTAVRASFKAWAETNLLLCEGRAYVTRGMPVLVPHARLRNPVLDRPPTDWSAGPAFERTRMHLYRSHLARIRQTDAGPASAHFAEDHTQCPDVGGDLALFANAFPREIESLHARAVARARAGGREIIGVDGLLTSLRSFADLGLVRAVPPDRYNEVADLAASALAAIAEALPPGYHPSALPTMRAYVDCVARPALGPHVPEADLDSLSELAPGP
jgi:hypothetical protein